MSSVRMSGVASLAVALASFARPVMAATHNIAKREVSDAEYYRLVVAHAALGGVATMIIFPLGILGARWSRLAWKRWWILHSAVQGLIGASLIIATFAISYVMVGEGQWDRPGHRRTGLVLFILVIVQSVAGVFIKATGRTAIHHKSPGLFGHPIQGWVHVLLGLTIVGLGFYQTYSGFDLFNRETDRTVPLAVYIMWGALAGATVVTYLLSLAWLPLQFRREAEHRDGIPPTKYGTSGTATQNSFAPGQTDPAAVSHNGTYVEDSRVQSIDDSRRNSMAPLVNHQRVEPNYAGRP